MKKMLVVLIIAISISTAISVISDKNFNIQIEDMQKIAFKLGAATALDMRINGDFQDIGTIGEAAGLAWAKHKNDKGE